MSTAVHLFLILHTSKMHLSSEREELYGESSKRWFLWQLAVKNVSCFDRVKKKKAETVCLKMSLISSRLTPRCFFLLLSHMVRSWNVQQQLRLKRPMPLFYCAFIHLKPSSHTIYTGARQLRALAVSQ